MLGIIRITTDSQLGNKNYSRARSREMGHTVLFHLINAIHSVIQSEFIILSFSYLDCVDFSQMQIYI